MIISHKHKFIFIRPRKTAGTTMQNVLSQICGDNDIVTSGYDDGNKNIDQSCWDGHPHPHLWDVKQLVGEDIWREYFKFTFVRNPFDRFVSAYSDFTQIRNLNLTTFKDFCKSFPDSEFSEDIHWIPQHKLLCDDETIVPDFIGRYENISDDLKKISDIIGFDINIGHHRKTKRKSYL